MLSDYLQSINTYANIKLAIEFSKSALPIWFAHFNKKPEDVALLRDKAKERNPDFEFNMYYTKNALFVLEQFVEANKHYNESLWAKLKREQKLIDIWHQLSIPIQISDWDDLLPLTTRLSYTCVWNIFTAISCRKNNDAEESHFYISINQSADCLMQTERMTKEEIESKLMEYKNFPFNANEEALWDKAEVLKIQENTNESIYKSIIQHQPPQVTLSREAGLEILRQMREEGKSYWNMMDEYFSGTSTTYEYNTEKQTFWITEVDVIVGSFMNQYPVSEEDMLHYIRTQSKTDLQQSGFSIG